MKRLLTQRQFWRFKFMCQSTFALLLLAYVGNRFVLGQLDGADALPEGPPYDFKGTEYQKFKRFKTPRGYIDEYTNNEGFCQSFVLPLGLELENDVLMGIVYLLALFYMFMGIAIISDIFMESIEQITAQTRMKTYIDNFGKEMQYEVTVWNSTVANLTLMALGSSAPEILLSVYETIMYINSTPGELGPSTIVGSAAFNLLIISAVSIVAVDEVKKVDDMGVFTITSVASLFAYIWLYIVLKVWTPGFVTVIEALLTLIYFFLLIAFAYCADKVRQARLKKEEDQRDQGEVEKEKLRLCAKAYLRKVAQQFGQQFVIQCGSEEKSTSAQTTNQQMKEEVVKAYRQVLGIADCPEIPLEDFGLPGLIQALEADNLIDRIAHRKMAGTGATEKKVNAKKGAQQQLEHKQAKLNNPNPKIGFKYTHVSVTESSGHVEISIVKKVNEEMIFFVRTRNGTAETPDDYEAFQKMIKMRAGEKETQIQIKVIDDNIWEPDKDFYVEICESKAGDRLIGDDTMCTVTILDEDQPGMIGFDAKVMQVRAKDKFAFVKVTRTDGADGDIKCRIRTVVFNDIARQAKEYDDFIPIDETLSFQHQETEKIVKIELTEKFDKESGYKSGRSSQRSGSAAESGAEDEDAEETSDDDEDRMDAKMLVFQVRLENPQPEGTRLAKNRIQFIQIMDNEEKTMSKEDQLQQQMLQYMLARKDPSWCQQFKIAVMLGPTLDDENNMEDVDGQEAFCQFLAIGWKVLFACVPPRKYCNGWLTFFVALIAIGACTAIVAEFANLLGCAIKLRQAVTAITLVALGTSLPDTLASKISAQNSPNADAAIGNITGSNSVNVFLGLGLPWTIAAFYRQNQTGEDYAVPAGTLAFSVALFLATAIVCFMVLVCRRSCIGGELGGPKCSRNLSAVLLCMLWVVYITFSTLQAYEYIEGF